MAITGHSAKSQAKNYLDKKQFVRGLRGAGVLAGNPRITVTVYWPCPSWLGVDCKADFDRLIDVVLVECDLIYYKRGGKMFLLIVVSVCSFIMRQEDVEEKFGSEFAGLKWYHEAAVKAKLTSKDPDLNHPVAVFRDWGRRLKAEFLQVNRKAFLPDAQ